MVAAHRDRRRAADGPRRMMTISGREMSQEGATVTRKREARRNGERETGRWGDREMCWKLKAWCSEK